MTKEAMIFSRPKLTGTAVGLTLRHGWQPKKTNAIFHSAMHLQLIWALWHKCPCTTNLGETRHAPLPASGGVDRAHHAKINIAQFSIWKLQKIALVWVTVVKAKEGVSGSER